MNFFFKYIYFFSIPIAAINSLIIKRRFSEEKELTFNEKKELNKFIFGNFASMSIPFTLLGILQLIGGHEHCFFEFSTYFQDITILFSWIVLFVAWAFLLYWVWFCNGAKILVKYRKAFNLPENELVVKFLTTLCVISGSFALVMGSIHEMSDQVSNSIKNSVTIKSEKMIN